MIRFLDSYEMFHQSLHNASWHMWYGRQMTLNQWQICHLITMKLMVKWSIAADVLRPKAPKHIDCLVQDCSNSIADALELLQSCTKPLIYCTQMDAYDTNQYMCIQKHLQPNAVITLSNLTWYCMQHYSDWDRHKSKFVLTKDTPDSKVHGPTWSPPGDDRWAPCWPYEPCYQGPHISPSRASYGLSIVEVSD